jgi:hypothetical protein
MGLIMGLLKGMPMGLLMGLLMNLLMGLLMGLRMGLRMGLLMGPFSRIQRYTRSLSKRSWSHLHQNFLSVVHGNDPQNWWIVPPISHTSSCLVGSEFETVATINLVHDTGQSARSHGFQSKTANHSLNLSVQDRRNLQRDCTMLQSFSFQKTPYNAVTTSGKTKEFFLTFKCSPGMTTPVGLLGVVTTTSFGFGRARPESASSSQPVKAPTVLLGPLFKFICEKTYIFKLYYI